MRQLLLPLLLAAAGCSLTEAALTECPRGGKKCVDDGQADVCNSHGLCCSYELPVDDAFRCYCVPGWAGVYCNIAVPEVDWMAEAQARLTKVRDATPNTNKAKNVILFIGDGLDLVTLTSARILKGQQAGRTGEETRFSFENFPVTGLSKTYVVNHQTPDSAATASAIMSGQKVNYATVGVNQKVIRYDCPASVGNHITSIFDWAQDEGLWTGGVTNTRVTHATPASAYANSAERFWESDGDYIDKWGNDYTQMANQYGCKDIAWQFVHEKPGKDMHVMLGGGRSKFMRDKDADPEYPTKKGNRKNMDLIQKWKQNHAQSSHKYVWNKAEFDAVDPTTTDYLLGLFERSHMRYEYDRANDPGKEPSLTDMTKKAIDILKRGDDGFLLLVEGGRIDHGHHAGKARVALEETIEFDNAVQAAIDATDEKETLIIVTADHAHMFSMGGYNQRGADILGFMAVPDIEPAQDGFRRTILGFMDGPGGLNRTARTDPELQVTGEYDYLAQALVRTNEESHGGQDVAIFAQGPMAHLLSGHHEQNYIAHALAYAACFGDNQEHCSGTAQGSTQAQPPPHSHCPNAAPATGATGGALALVLLVCGLLLR